MEIWIKCSGLEELSLMFYIALLSLWGTDAFRTCPPFSVKLTISLGRGSAQWQGEQNKVAEGLSRILCVIEQNSCRCPSRQSSDNKENSGHAGGDICSTLGGSYQWGGLMFPVRDTGSLLYICLLKNSRGFTPCTIPLGFGFWSSLAGAKRSYLPPKDVASTSQRGAVWHTLGRPTSLLGW